MKSVQYHFNKANLLAEKQVIKLARTILKNHPEYDEFIIAMGSYFFTNKKTGQNITPMEENYRNNQYVSDDRYKYFKPLNDFILKWNDNLYLTGMGIRFKAKGKIKRHW